MCVGGGGVARWGGGGFSALSHIDIPMSRGQITLEIHVQFFYPVKFSGRGSKQCERRHPIMFDFSFSFYWPCMFRTGHVRRWPSIEPALEICIILDRLT